MQRERQFDDAEIGRQMTAVDRAGAHEQIADLAREHVDLLTLQTLDVGRRVDALDDHWRVIRKFPLGCPAQQRPPERSARRLAAPHGRAIAA